MWVLLVFSIATGDVINSAFRFVDAQACSRAIEAVKAYDWGEPVSAICIDVASVRS